MAGREERRKRGEERQREEGNEDYLTTMRWWPERRRRRAETASLGETASLTEGGDGELGETVLGPSLLVDAGLLLLVLRR